MRYLIYRPVVGEYGVEALPGDVVRDMNALAEDGWELVQVIERVSTTRIPTGEAYYTEDGGKRQRTESSVRGWMYQIWRRDDGRLSALPELKGTAEDGMGAA